MGKPNLKKELFLKAYAESFGHVSKACQSCNISRYTYYDWITPMEQGKPSKSYDAKFAQDVREIDESFLDVCESKVKEKILAGEWTQIKYYLETHGKSRGYTGERQRMEVDGTLKLDIQKSIVPGGATE